MDTSTPDTEATPGRRWNPPAWLRALTRATAMTAAMTAAGYAAHRWAATGLPMEPLPGSPWPYLIAWAALTFTASLLLQWGTSGIDYDGRWSLVALPVFAGIRLSLAHRPDPALLYAYGLAALAAAAAGIILWRRRAAAARGR
ncbi:hypothetical protein ACFY7H_04730 [Streptomyces sp. NPDC012794]|uniref:hypothetical protein n=1 Tax=Streptomyces sp. NPDC012794 TaxID=3364850 RepID=UPI0036894F2A